MNMLALALAADTQQADMLGSLQKPLVVILVLLAVLKIAPLLLPKSKRRSQRSKPNSESRPLRNRNLIPCQDCNGLISPKASVCPHCGAPIDANYAKEMEEKIGKKRKAEQEADFVAKSAMLFFVGLAIIFVAFVLGSNLKFRLFGIFIGLFLIALSLVGTYVFYNKGKVGELIVMTRLRKGLPEDEYEILNNIYLPTENGTTTQVDHVVVSRFGVFVVETKNYSGWIFADASSKVWTQTIYRTKSTFQNPIRQNYRHVCAIAENLGLPKDYIRGVVAFTGDCEFKTPMPEGVVYSRRLADYIKSFSDPILKDGEKEEILEALREWDASVTPEQRAAHVDNLRQRHGTAEASP